MQERFVHIEEAEVEFLFTHDSSQLNRVDLMDAHCCKELLLSLDIRIISHKAHSAKKWFFSSILFLEKEKVYSSEKKNANCF